MNPTRPLFPYSVQGKANGPVERLPFFLKDADIWFDEKIMPKDEKQR